MQNANTGEVGRFVDEVARAADVDRRTVLAVLAGVEPRSRAAKRAVKVIAELRAKSEGAA